jgi:methylthioribose-1-phosphate isomerase
VSANLLKEKSFMTAVKAIQSVQLDDENNTVIILDQTLLPNEKVFLHLSTPEEIWEAITI